MDIRTIDLFGSALNHVDFDWHELDVSFNTMFRGHPVVISPALANAVADVMSDAVADIRSDAAAAAASAAFTAAVDTAGATLSNAAAAAGAAIHAISAAAGTFADVVTDAVSAAINDAGASLANLPAMHAMPEMPAMPAMPAMPEMPVMPAMPEMPVMPAMPEMPAMPAMPEMPAMPAMPPPTIGVDIGQAMERVESAVRDGIADAKAALDHGWPMGELGMPGTLLPLPGALPLSWSASDVGLDKLLNALDWRDVMAMPQVAQVALNATPMVAQHVADLALTLAALPVDAIADAFDHWQSWLLPMSNPVITA